jgi:hypothetical protein
MGHARNQPFAGGEIACEGPAISRLDNLSGPLSPKDGIAPKSWGFSLESTELNALGHARLRDFSEPAEVSRHFPTTLAAWRDDRTRIEEALQHSNEKLRTICGAIRAQAFSLSSREPNAHGKLTSQGGEELADIPRQIAMLKAWRARRDRIAEALRDSDGQLLAVCKEVCCSGLERTLRIA